MCLLNPFDLFSTKQRTKPLTIASPDLDRFARLASIGGDALQLLHATEAFGLGRCGVVAVHGDRE